MNESPAAGKQTKGMTVLGWLIAGAFAALLINIIQMPRTALDQREMMHAFHYSAGLFLSILAIVRLYYWIKDPAPQPPETIPAASFGFNRAILFALLLVFAVESAIGFAYAWGAGHEVSLFGLPIPDLMGKSEGARMSMGYFHSALGFYYLMLLSIWLAFGFYQSVRFKAGWKRLFPGPSV